MTNVEAVVNKLVKEYFDIEEGIKSIVWVNPKQPVPECHPLHYHL